VKRRFVEEASDIAGRRVLTRNDAEDMTKSLDA
jgi:hypothetical protein